MLSVGFGSSWSRVAVTVLTIVPGASGRRTIRTAAEAPWGRVPRLAITSLPTRLTLPWPTDALTKVVSAGSGSSRTTFEAEPGPLLVTMTV